MAWIAWLQRFLALCFCIALPLVAGLWWTGQKGVASRGLVPLRIAAPSAAVPVRPGKSQAVQSHAVRTQRVRVGLTPQPVASVTMSVSSPYQAVEPGKSRTLHEAAELASCKVTPTEKGWRIGTREFTAGRLEIRPRKSPAIWVNGHQYRGVVRLERKSGGKLLAVNELPLEEYVASVIDSEMPAEFGHEARSAQAVVARTFAVYQIKHAAADDVVDVYATTRSQKYLGYQYRDKAGRLLAGESDGSRKIAAETQGLVCTWQGKPFRAYYCATCGGATLQGTEFFDDAAPPLKSVPCTWCSESPLAHWSLLISRATLEQDLRAYLDKRGSDPGRLQKIASESKPSPGRMRQFEYRGERSKQRLTGAEVRTALAARGVCSPTLTIDDRGATCKVSGRGNGHGVGLCQWGARGLGHSGRTWREIIAHYYPGAKVEKLSSL